MSRCAGRYGELGVWFFSTLLFGLLHLPNTLFRTGPLGVTQVLTAMIFGSVLYLARRLSGSLTFAMGLHALWDFSSFAVDGAAALTARFIAGIVAVVVAYRLTRRESKEESLTPA